MAPQEEVRDLMAAHSLFGDLLGASQCLQAYHGNDNNRSTQYKSIPGEG
jgi:hypothetical protein